ncbi:MULTISPECIES: hypothetical protein [unclassified Mesorhizobium]|uniref:hypothetical protein n=1 Tax=unclassified Mesorhizobium TaxID=325217 RepID=UPI000FD3A693|nr:MULTISPECIES: hypothetical protein [unclassified Mesorhizobium]RVB79837.1 hypothetical protein EN885_02840 [Mesorhizobium sp. M6A.T.Cr.TU.014.01.1.1]RWP73799.1 MAG: hypothetical protein EOR09_17685 [Mesorhizobium sp.]RWP81811.1 MAG: hypothetical protein EOR10_04095 [Mesorhizobium sp.]RWQ08744.1 MAG: hypothetical protein EOR90_09375 [Mesorhizobium sp.]RWQ12401.1 MAG: hypothetical protein EOR91_01435 [Mesorhizobium sp.]
MRAMTSYCLSMAMLLPLLGCGTTIPNMTTSYPREGDGERLEEVELVQLIKCELHYGVQEALAAFPANQDELSGYDVEWLRNWEAKMSLKITVDEKSTLMPGLTYKLPLHTAVSQFNVPTPQNFSASIGLQASSQGTRSETIGFSYKFADLLKEPELNENSCKSQIKNKIVLNNLKIPEFIFNKAYVANHTDAVVQRDGESPYSTFSDDITFIVTYGGNVTPVWNLLQVTANSTSPLYNSVRTKTHNLTITLGKVGSAQAAAVANANLIGQAVARALNNR